MSTLEERCNSLAELKKTLDAEDLARAKIKYSDEYVAINKQIEALQEQQVDMLYVVPNSGEAFNSLRQEVIDMMNRERVFAAGNVTAKFKEKNEVNTSKVLQVIGGDMDIYISLSNITQVKLKDFAKVTPELKTDLLGCIETVSKDIVDLVIESPAA